jgi:hypothetical protein
VSGEQPPAFWHTPRMAPAKLAAPLALAGGLLWILHALIGGGSDPFAAVLHFLGLACVLAAAGLFGSGLVKSDAVGMRVLVGLASALLALSVVEAFRPPDSAWYDGGWGIVAALLGGIALVRRRGTGRTSGGAHSR